MKNMKHLLTNNMLITAGLALCNCVSTFAYTQPKDSVVNRTVTVEIEYNPAIADAEKISIQPQVEEPIITKGEVEYAMISQPMLMVPTEQMPIRNITRKEETSTKGYVRVGYGNYNNLDAAFNYLWKISQKDRLHIDAKADGMKGELDMPFVNNTWDARYYRAHFNMSYQHIFKHLAMNLESNYHWNKFNYSPFTKDLLSQQLFSYGGGHLGFESIGEGMVDFKAGIHAGGYNKDRYSLDGDITEIKISPYAVVSGAINEEQRVGIGIEANSLLYTVNALQEFYKEQMKKVYGNRTTVHLNPFYELDKNDWLIHIGANVDLSFNNGRQFYFSPDITAQYIFGRGYAFYAQATGGRMLSDFRHLEVVNPYLQPTNVVSDTYEQLNFTVGLKGSPANGFWFNVFGRYQNLQDELYQKEESISLANQDNPIKYINLFTTDFNSLQAGLELSYEFKDRFSIAAGATYYHWNSKDKLDEMNGKQYNPTLWMKPKLKVNGSIKIRPIQQLEINASYNHINRAETYMPVYNKHMGDVQNLKAGAKYTFSNFISVFVQFDNLLNKDYQYYLGYPSEGFNFLAGASIRF